MTLAPSPIPGLDDVDWDMLSRGDRLGPDLGAKVACLLESLSSQVNGLDEPPTRDDDVAAAAILYQCADCVRAEREFSCYNREDVFVIGNEIICTECAAAGHLGQQRRKVHDIPAKLKRQRMHAASQQSRATAAEGRVALLEEEREEARDAWRQSQAALEPFWGPWTTHRGRHDPLIDGDELVMVLFRDNDEAIGRVHDWDHNWQWTDDDAPEPGNIIMYRSLADARARLAKGGQ